VVHIAHRDATYVLEHAADVFENTADIFENAAYVLKHSAYVLKDTTHVLKHSAYVLKHSAYVLKDAAVRGQSSETRAARDLLEIEAGPVVGINEIQAACNAVANGAVEIHILRVSVRQVSEVNYSVIVPIGVW
jgi:hypothetical protein